MAWLRIDDGMPEHRKVLALPRKDRWTWLELLAYVARQNNGGHVPPGVTGIIRYVTPAFLRQCVDAGLLDRDDSSGYAVHDWDDYNPKDPTAAERMKRLRLRKRDVNVTDTVTESVTETETPPARAGARGPSPTPTPSTQPAAQRPSEDPDHDAAKRLLRAGWTQGQVHQTGDRIAEALAHLEAAEADPSCTTPGALAWTKFKSGEPPTTHKTHTKTCPICHVGITPPTTLADHMHQQHEVVAA